MENFRSVSAAAELSLVANTRLNQLSHHVVQAGKVGVVRLCGIYGANGSGKSTMVDALRLVQDTVLNGEHHPNLVTLAHRFNGGTDKPITIVVDFAVEERMYGLAIRYGFERIEEEELYEYPAADGVPELLYHRSAERELTFGEEGTQAEPDAYYELIKEFTTDTRSVLKSLTVVDHPRRGEFQRIYDWFTNRLLILGPRDYLRNMAQRFDQDPDLLAFARKLIRTYHVGIQDIVIERLTPEAYFGQDNQKDVDYIRAAFKNGATGKTLSKYLGDNDEISVVGEAGGPVVKLIKFVKETHTERQTFRLSEVSDGTSRLLEFIPVFYRLLHQPDTVVIDELERSIHPLMIQSLLKKFSIDVQARGQLIFTTHDDNLLDHAILRRDGTYFAEKSVAGETELHSLNQYKPHHTTNIRRGYLAGRYGGIPSVQKLRTTSWNHHDRQFESV